VVDAVATLQLHLAIYSVCLRAAAARDVCVGWVRRVCWRVQFISAQVSKSSFSEHCNTAVLSILGDAIGT
jgi:hypothetical protein